MALPASNPSPLTRRDLTAPALRAFFNITRLWDLSTEQERTLLGSPGRSTFFRWKRDLDGALPHDVLERISYLLGIYKALEILFPEPKQADAWVKRPSEAPVFGGQSALERMLGGQVADLFVVRQYLDAQRG
ncbi:MbcA/ParS/Xre antitoxin family protein [Lysobacter sp. GX 14042]|uniref:MbcA/ParS/Xre antitoxin family protein n=1 Tax=Lysobacter sp. GX 14042 TaxID=2907155 RepID=UPI001F2A0E1D|nr:MbcA/ParS/Xre antitoxin family protein [Lysobacter sp. GX 14042]MCE7031459.1 MbcA/ParS/Xre antitoxin family protein [Lysobacter sp. GX 14042]